MNYKDNVELLEMKELTTLDFVVEKLKELDFGFKERLLVLHGPLFHIIKKI